MMLQLNAQSDSLTGSWRTVTEKLDDGSDYKVYFQLKQAGSEISGRVVYPWGHCQVTGGKSDGKKIHFVQHLWEGMDFEVSGELIGRDLHYKATGFDHRWHEYVGQSVPADKGNPPPALPLPEARSVPDNGLARTAPMGWNSWNKFGTKVTDALIREMADRIASNGMRDAGYVYVNIDDAWEGQRDKAGRLQPNPKFPDMTALAAYVHSNGLKLGIYSSPGPKTCGGYEGSFGHEELDAKAWAEWGIDYLKHDSCSVSKVYENSRFGDVYQKMGEALRETGRPIVFSISSEEDAYQ